MQLSAREAGKHDAKLKETTGDLIRTVIVRLRVAGLCCGVLVQTSRNLLAIAITVLIQGAERVGRWQRV